MRVRELGLALEFEASLSMPRARRSKGSQLGRGCGAWGDPHDLAA